MQNSIEITILCKVVDNFGDIGVVYRLARSLKRRKFNDIQISRINIVTDDLKSFNKINNLINPEKSFQVVEGIEVFDWKDFSLCYEAFCGDRLQVVLECFQCGRPDWMEKILFDNELSRTVNIIMIDYLSAEDYAETFHCLKSLTRRKLVQKVNFMPGFTEKTGGLLLDERKEINPAYKNAILFFCYDKDWSLVLKAIERYKEKNQIKVLAAPGKGFNSFIDSYKKNQLTFEYETLQFVNQEKWDEILNSCKFLFIRGEDSLRGACISGIPFVWHAYPQSENYQVVKVNALLEKMKPFFSEVHFDNLKTVWLYVNDDVDNKNDQKFSESLNFLFENMDSYRKEFKCFSENQKT